MAGRGGGAYINGRYVQGGKGGGRGGKDGGKGAPGDQGDGPRTRGWGGGDEKWERKPGDEDVVLETKFDVAILQPGETRVGYMFNMKPTRHYDESGRNLTGMLLYFLQRDGTTFRATFLYRPYFFVQVGNRENLENVRDILAQRFQSDGVNAAIVEKEDLALEDHLVGKRRKLIKLSFDNDSGKDRARRDLAGEIKRTRKVESFSFDSPGKQQANSGSVANIEELYEYDVPYVCRVCIDNGLNCGKWFEVARNQLATSSDNIWDTQCTVKVGTDERSETMRQQMGKWKERQRLLVEEHRSMAEKSLRLHFSLLQDALRDALSTEMDEFEKLVPGSMGESHESCNDSQMVVPHAVMGHGHLRHRRRSGQRQMEEFMARLSPSGRERRAKRASVGSEGMREHLKLASNWVTPRDSINVRPPVGGRFCPYHFFPHDLENTFMYKVTNHSAFHIVVGVLIMLNTVLIGVHANIAMRAVLAGEPVDRWHDQAEFALMVAFVVEICMRIMGDRCYYFTGKYAGWNLFDLILMLASVFNEFSEGHNLTFLRAVRVVRVTRMVRVIQYFGVFMKLRVLARSIFGAIVSLLWASIFIVLVMYLWAVAILQGVAGELEEHPDDYGHLYEHLQRDYADLLRTILTLFMSITGGDDWRHFAEDLGEIDAFYMVLFYAYILFVVLGVLNVTTGVFVEAAMEVARHDRDRMIQEELESQNSYMNKMADLLHEVDTDNSGEVSWAELHKVMDDPRMRASFAALQINVSEAEGLFRLLDVNGTGEIPIEEFIISCLRLKGEAKRLDVATLIYDQKKLSTLIQSHFHEVDCDLQELRSFLRDLVTRLVDARDNHGTASNLTALDEKDGTRDFLPLHEPMDESIARNMVAL